MNWFKKTHTRNTIYDKFDKGCHSKHIGMSTPVRTEDEIVAYIAFNIARITGTPRPEGQVTKQFPTSGEVGGRRRIRKLRVHADG